MVDTTINTGSVGATGGPATGGQPPAPPPETSPPTGVSAPADTYEAQAPAGAQTPANQPASPMPPIGRAPLAPNAAAPTDATRPAATPQRRPIGYDPRVDGGISGIIDAFKRVGIPTDEELEEYFGQVVHGIFLKTVLSWGNFRNNHGSFSPEHMMVLRKIVGNDPNGSWRRLVDKAAKNDTLDELLFHFLPVGKDKKTWRKELDEAKKQGSDALLRLAKNRPAIFLVVNVVTDPTKVTRANWEVVVANAIAEGTPEDVTQEPRTDTTRRFLLPVYRALREWANRSGFELDPVLDFGAAVDVSMRRVVIDATRSLQSGSSAPVNIDFEIPEFMRGVPFENFSLQSFASAYANYPLGMDTPQLTRDHHAKGDRRHARASTLRGYERTARDSGHTRAQTLKLRDFASLMLWLDFFESATPDIYDELDRRIFNPPDAVGSRARIRLLPSKAVYVAGTGPRETEGPTSGSIALDIITGRMSSLIYRTATYLDALQISPYQLTLEDTPEDAPLDTLLDKMRQYKDGHARYEAAFTDPRSSSSLKNTDDVIKMRRFYRDAIDFCEHVLTMMRVTAKTRVASEHVDLDVSIVPKVDGKVIQVISSGRILIVIDDIETARVRGEITDEEVLDVIKLRVALGYALFSGRIHEADMIDDGEIGVVASDVFKSDETRTRRAIDIHLALTRQPFHPTSVGSSFVLRRLRASGRIVTEPITSPLRLSRPWVMQWTEYATTNKLSPEEASKATHALRAYFRAVPFYVRYDEGILQREINRVFQTPASQKIFAVVPGFFQSLGIVYRVPPTPVATASPAMIAMIAVGVAARYAELALPISARSYIPINEALLVDVTKTFVTGGNIENAVINQARNFINVHNRTAVRPPPTAIAKDQSTKAGVVGSLISAHIDNWAAGHATFKIDKARIMAAYYQWAAGSLAQDEITQGDLIAALDNIEGNGSTRAEAVCLLDFLKSQREALKETHDLLTDDKLGLMRYAEARFSSQPFAKRGTLPLIMTRDDLYNIAFTYISHLLGLSIQISLFDIAYELAGERYLPHEHMATNVADAYSKLVSSWLNETHTSLRGRASNIHAATMFNDDPTYIPESEAAFQTDILEVTGEASIEGLKDLDRHLVHLSKFFDGERLSPAHDAVTGAWRETFEPRYREFVEAHKDDIARVEKVINDSAEFATRVQTESARYLTDPDYSALTTIPKSEAALAEVQNGIAIFAGLTTEIDVLRARFTEAKSISAGLHSKKLSERLGQAGLDLERDAKTVDDIKEKLVARKARIDEITAKLKKAERTKKLLLEGETLKNDISRAAEDLSRMAQATKTQTMGTTASKDSLARLRTESRNSSPLTASEFDEHTAHLDKRIASANKSSDKLQRSFGTLKIRLDTIHAKDLRDKVTALKGIVKELGNEAPPAFASAIDKLSSAIKEAEGILAAAEACERDVVREIGAAGRTYEAYEERLVPQDTFSDFSPQPIKPTQVAEYNGDHYTFEGRTLEATKPERIESEFYQFTKSRVVVIRDEMHMVPSDAATSIETWRKSLREQDLTFNDSLGRPHTIKAGTRGVVVLLPARLNETHPIRTLVRNLNAITRTNSPELHFVLSFLREWKKGAAGKILFLDLIGALAASNPDMDAHATVRLFALQRISDVRALGGHMAEQSNLWYRSQRERELAQVHPLYGNSYTREMHLAMAARFAIDDVRASSEQPSQNAILHAVYSDPNLMSLGWIRQQAGWEEKVDGLIGRLYQPPDGQSQSVSLRKLQDIAIDLYLSETTGLNRYPELDGLIIKPLMELFDAEISNVQSNIVHARQRYLGYLHSSLTFRRVMSALSHLQTLRYGYNEEEFRATFLSPIIDLDLERDDDQESLSRWIKVVGPIVERYYREHRPEQGNMNPRYSIMARLGGPDFFTTPADIANEFPEAAHVRVGWRYFSWQELHNDDQTQGRSKTDIFHQLLGNAVEFAPDTLPLISLLSVAVPVQGATRKLTLDFFDEIQRLTRPAEPDAREIRRAIIDYYRAVRGPIRATLDRTIGTTRETSIYRMTGMRNPWDRESTTIRTTGDKGSGEGKGGNSSGTPGSPVSGSPSGATGPASPTPAGTPAEAKSAQNGPPHRHPIPMSYATVPATYVRFTGPAPDIYRRKGRKKSVTGGVAGDPNRTSGSSYPAPVINPTTTRRPARIR